MNRRLIVLTATLVLFAAAAIGQPLLPRCSAGLDGQVSGGGCVCRHDNGGQLTGRAPGWRWSCDLLRGPGMVEVVPPAGSPVPGLPPGFTYAPGMSGASGTGGAGGRAVGY